MFRIGVPADANDLKVTLFCYMPCQPEHIVTRLYGDDVDQNIFLFRAHVKPGHLKPFLVVKDERRVKDDIDIPLQQVAQQR